MCALCMFCITSDTTNMRCALLKCSSLEFSAGPGRCWQALYAWAVWGAGRLSFYS